MRYHDSDATRQLICTDLVAAYQDPTVYVVDDDESIRDALDSLIATNGYSVETFAKATDFLRICDTTLRGCVLLDVCLPDMSGLDVQRCLADQKIFLPIIFLTGCGDLRMSSQAFRGGAVDFLEKPFRSSDLLIRVAEALQRDQQLWHQHARRAELLQRVSRLTGREWQIMKLVIRGHSSKQIGQMLSISDRTVEVHRAHLMEKMRAVSLADLIAIGVAIGIDPV